MPRRPPKTDPELQAHKEWLGYLQPRGLVVAPAAMWEAGWVLEQSGKELLERQEQFREALQPLGHEEDDEDDQPRGFRRLDTLLVEQLSWDADALQRDESTLQTWTRELPELGETLAPTAVVRGFGADDKLQLLIQELPELEEGQLPPGEPMDFDRRQSSGDQGWRASPQERFERLLRETEVQLGLLFNGSQLRLVVAPKGESSGHLTFTLAELAQVSGRAMFAGLRLLLGREAVLDASQGLRLVDVIEASRNYQAVVSEELADQVLAGLWQLLRGFQRADQLSSAQGARLPGDIRLNELAENEPQALYGGLITVMLRLVFLLYAEDTDLMPNEPVFEQNYKLTTLLAQLQRDAASYPDTMEQRYGAWSGICSLFKLVYVGGGPTADYLPARKGKLFKPSAYPWLETPWMSDAVVLAVLSNLLIVKGERINYRALDVRQIGSVYEGIMDFAVARIAGPCIGLRSKAQGGKKPFTTAIDLAELLALPGSKRKAWLEQQAHTDLPAKAVAALKEARSEQELVAALAPRIDRRLFDGVQAAGSLVFQPTEERRRSGSHYTPAQLTQLTVADALRPWLERHGHRPTPEQILALRICDPAMGSGAFLVELCRFLAELLLKAWGKDLPDELLPGGSAYGEEPLILARRLVAQRCLYGVDKNPFAVNLARLSLWLVTLSKHLPFTFVDHALKEGDSLVGMDLQRIEEATAAIQLGMFDGPPRSLLQNLAAAREAVFSVDSRSDADAERKQEALDEQKQASDPIRQVGDLLVAAFFQGGNAKARANLQEEAIRELNQGMSAEQIKAIRAELAGGAKGIRPFHWVLEFPEVFQNGRGGFDAFVGNPPFAGKNTITEGSRAGFLDWLKQLHPESHGNADLVAHFFRRCFDLLRPEGAMGLIATNTIAQGDTRSTGLRWICLNGGTIVAARKRYRWPGVAAVVVSIVHVLKGLYSGERTLDGRRVEQITAFLFDKGGHEDPKPLKANAGKSFQGSIVLGMGFTFDDSGEADNDTPGIPSPIATMERLIAENPKNAEVIFPYIGGKEVNDSPTHAHHRYVINFGERSEEECRRGWPELMRIVERKVKPGRLLQNREVRARYWWRFGESCPALYAAISSCTEVAVVARTSRSLALANVNSTMVFSENLIVFAVLTPWPLWPLVQCQIHDIWVRSFTSSFKDDLAYRPSDVFDTFPFAISLLDQGVSDVAQTSNRRTLRSIGERYHQFRAELMMRNNEGLTSTYNRFHDPAETSDGILELRRLHDEMDQAVLAAYGWSDALPTATDTTPDTSPCGFGLDYLDTEDDALLPPDLQERISSGNLFFPTAAEACSFQAQLRRYGAVKPSRRLAWRHRWPDAVRDDVLARLLALNAERYAEEQAMGLQGKGGKKPAAAPTASGKRRGRPPKATPSGDVEQIGLSF
ncbi:BREX-1 system adenine-specific DNA-methyltransferase PglX [Cyanobium sp. FGCU-6]|nr:BREX-1 system adenine-specific DNA-methyltransferase PglX [Cyanobium sp. FGCU6]